MRILIVIYLLFHFFLGTNACTEIRVTAEDKSVIIGRTMEYSIDTFSYLIVEPVGYNHAAKLAKGCPSGGDRLSWSNKYTVTYINAWKMINVAADGLNSAGLSAGALMFPGFTKYQEVPPSKCGEAVSQTEFILWLLGNFGSVQEVRDSISSGSFPLVFGGSVLGTVFELHFSVIDKTGDAIVIEYAETGRQVYNNTLGVMTNAPPYDFHMLNLRNYVQLSKFNNGPLVLGTDEFPPTGEGSGLLGMPGDLTPPSRFVRAAVLKGFAKTPKTNTAAVNLAFHVLNSVNIPHGVITKPILQMFGDFTVWSVAKDLTNNAVYFRDYNDLTVRVVYLNNVQQEKVMAIKMFSKIAGFQNVTSDMKPLGDAREDMTHDEL